MRGRVGHHQLKPEAVKLEEGRAGEDGNPSATLAPRVGPRGREQRGEAVKP